MLLGLTVGPTPIVLSFPGPVLIFRKYEFGQIHILSNYISKNPIYSEHLA